MVDFEATECDGALEPGATQQEAFLQARPLIKSFLKGTNCTVLAYGPTGSGKTHTLLGAPFYDCLQLDNNILTPTESSPGSTFKKNSSLTRKQIRLKKQASQFTAAANQAGNANMISERTYIATPKKNAAVENLVRAPIVSLSVMRLLQEMVLSE